MKKYGLKILCYSGVGVLLAYAERVTGLNGLNLAFCAALVFCRENLLLAILPYAVTGSLVHFDLMYSAVVFSGVFCLSVYTAICYKAKLKYRIWANVIVIAVSQVPCFLLFGTGMDTLVRAAASVPVSIIYHYICVAVVYPVLVRGIRYELTDREKIFSALFVVPLFAALAAFDIKGVGFYYFALTVMCLVGAQFGGAWEMGIAIGAGAGASLITLDPLGLCISAAIGGTVCALRNVNKYVGGPGAMLAYLACMLLFGQKLTLSNTVPVAVACLVVLIPAKVFYRGKRSIESYHGKFALRTLANRDREEVSGKLRNVSVALRRMKALLESDEPGAVKPEAFSAALSEACCADCGKAAVCREKTGGAVKYFNKMFTVGAANGRITLLDVDGTLGAACIRLPRVINVANAMIRDYLSAMEKRSGIEQGRDMVIGNLGGTAELLDELAAGVAEGFDFDVDGEKRIKEQLACANIIAADTAIYAGKVTLSVRECDEPKPELRKIISEAIGREMYVAERVTGLNGAVNLVLRPIPAFGVLYGEKSVSAEGECGDAKQAVKISPDKIMFVLSDGMGTGKEARKTGLGTIALIETFYRAGFRHNTIFGCVSGLLALRTKETFSALDVAVMDTQTGEIDFIKQGGRESYIVTEKGMEKIDGGSLPMGIIEDAEPIVVRKKLKGNDLVIMQSDGVADRLNETDVSEIVGALGTLNPQTIAEKIVENAEKRTDRRKDDMTVMVIRIVRNKEGL